MEMENTSMVVCRQKSCQVVAQRRYGVARSYSCLWADDGLIIVMSLPQASQGDRRLTPYIPGLIPTKTCSRRFLIVGATVVAYSSL